MKKYVIGIDFGTLSARCVVVDSADGRELSQSVFEYPHGVIEDALPSGKKLPPAFALQHPQDYLDALYVAVPDAVRKAGLAADDIAAVGFDFTTCTLIPVYEDGRPLCFDEKYADEPHAYAKLWKHSAAQPQADRINALAEKRGESWLASYGGKVSSTWVLPKICEMLDNAPEVFEKTVRFTEAGDWLSLILTGEETHSAALAGYKALWNEVSGYPSNEFLKELDQRLDGLVGTKLSNKVIPVGGVAGKLNERGAELTGLAVGTPVSLPMPDAHAAIPALGVCEPGQMVIVLGTSGCQFVHSEKKVDVAGICGCVKGAVVPEYYTYETGQVCVGDAFDRFVNNFVPERYETEARERGIGIHKLLREKAEKLKIGESGLLALDWFNGNRSILIDSELSGVILGLTVSTRPEHIYRALIEATAFGARMIIDNFERHGIEVGNICATGGISRKDEMMMQIYADVTGRQIKVASTSQGGALGSAIYASVAAGIYKDVREAAANMAVGYDRIYRPIPENREAYAKLYREYCELHDYFGRGENDVLKRLLRMKK